MDTLARVSFKCVTKNKGAGKLQKAISEIIARGGTEGALAWWRENGPPGARLDFRAMPGGNAHFTLRPS